MYKLKESQIPTNNTEYKKKCSIWICHKNNDNQKYTKKTRAKIWDPKSVSYPTISTHLRLMETGSFQSIKEIVALLKKR